MYLGSEAWKGNRMPPGAISLLTKHPAIIVVFTPCVLKHPHAVSHVVSHNDLTKWAYDYFHFTNVDQETQRD